MTNEGLVDREWYDRYILKKPEYGTPEYWIKERKSKFIRNARKKEDAAYRRDGSIIGIWTQQVKVEMPLYSMMSNKNTIRYE